MKILRRMIYRLRAVLSRPSDDQDLAAELESHIQLQTEDNLRAGMTPEAARRDAILKFGGIESVKASYREQRSLLIESLFSDLHYGARGLRRNPVFTLTVVAAL